MAVLQCEICGGKLIGKPGGIFECDSCGMEYSTEWAKEKIQEIKGTVKVEGTVEVTGKVQVEGGSVKIEGTVTKDSLLKRVKMCCAEAQWEKAKELLEQVFNADPECGEAYLYSYMTRHKLHTVQEVHDRYVSVDSNVSKDTDIEKAFSYATGEFAEALNFWKKEYTTAIESDIAHRQEICETLKQRREINQKSKGLISAVYAHTVGVRVDGTVMAVGDNEDGQCSVKYWKDIMAVACGLHIPHTVGLRRDGTVVAVGNNDFGQCNVSYWRNINTIVCGETYTVGLRDDGTAVAVGANDYGQCNLNDWDNIVTVACGAAHTVGLCADGTVVATGNNDDGRCDVSDWKNIVAITCGLSVTIGLCADGTVVATGINDDGLCDAVGSWHDIIAIACEDDDIVGLRADGTVVAVGEEVSRWRDIIAIACGPSHTVGLRADGTVIAVGLNSSGECNVSEWHNIIAIACGVSHTVGLHADGTVIATGENADGRCDTTAWKLFENIDTLEEERKAAHQIAEKKAAEARENARRAEVARRLAVQKALEADRIARRKKLECECANLKAELGDLKGFFSGKRRKEIETRLSQIERELRSCKP